MPDFVLDQSRAGSELVPRVHGTTSKAVDVREDMVGFHVTDFKPRFPMFAGPPDGVDPVGLIASLRRPRSAFSDCRFHGDETVKLGAMLR